MSKYKIWDRIKIKSNISRYNGYVEDMDKYIGKECLIVLMDDEGKEYYHINIDRERWWWHEDMLELIEEATQEEYKSSIDIGIKENIDLNQLGSTIKPMGFETINGRFSVECTDEETLTLIERDKDGYIENEFCIYNNEDLNTIIDLLQHAKDIETRTWETIQAEMSDD